MHTTMSLKALLKTLDHAARPPNPLRNDKRNSLMPQWEIVIAGCVLQAPHPLAQPIQLVLPPRPNSAR